LDGKEYIDYALGMGPAILGHAPKAITEAITKTLEQGQLYAGQSPLELELARRICQYVPGAERVRLGTTGTEMVQTAVRVARAATGRVRFVKFSGHYHGWLDNVLTNEVTFSPNAMLDAVEAQPQSAGQAQSALADTVVLPWNDLAVFRAYADRFGAGTAAIIMEPVLCNTGVIPPAPGYLERVRELCDEYGIVLIVDEVITGFRLGLHGAQGLLRVTGDLTILAKALGGGAPIAALAGRESLLSLIGSGSVNNSGTYNSNVIGLAAAIATIDALSAEDGAVYAQIERNGQALIEGLRVIAKAQDDNLIVQGYPSVFNTAFGDAASIGTVEDYRRCDEGRQKRFLAALLERGVRPMARGTWFVSAAHTVAEMEGTLAAVKEALKASR
jgi:glutamate-1-semialdehyde 2,1-aminomutase